MLVSGDCTVITTPTQKNIVIDTGEQENIIVKYLLDRKIKTIDYLMISHFDSDHSKNAVDIIENLKVKNIIISKQAEYSQEFENIMKAVKHKNVNIIIVKAGDIIKIDREISIRILWPGDKAIQENPLNNNSIVAKLEYKNFSMLFTGDIEKIAEEQILEKNNKQTLESGVLKVSHHGSNTSSTKEFIKTVNSKISLIGVGNNNKFGHPNSKTLITLENYGSKAYRTDLVGEITIIVNKKGKIKMTTQVK